MSNTYKHGNDVPVEVLATRLDQLSDAVTKNNMNEFTMRVPAELDRDADLVLMSASERLLSQQVTIGELGADRIYQASEIKRLSDQVEFLQAKPDSELTGEAYQEHRRIGLAGFNNACSRIQAVIDGGSDFCVYSGAFDDVVTAIGVMKRKIEELEALYGEADK